MAKCETNCEDDGADQRHALLPLLAEIGIFGSERYLGAGNTAIEIPDSGGMWSLTNLYDAVHDDWLASFEIEDGVVCTHILGDQTASLEYIAGVFRSECLLGTHPIPTNLGPLTPAEIVERDRQEIEHDRQFRERIPSL